MPENEYPTGFDNISANEVASYVSDVAEQLANMARMIGLEAVAAPLEQAHRAARAAVQGNTSPDDAA